PLQLYWRALSLHAAGHKAAARLVADLEAWLSEAPIPPVSGMSSQDLAEDLGLLAQTLFVSVHLRHHFGRRLVATHRATTSYDLARWFAPGITYPQRGVHRRHVG